MDRVLCRSLVFVVACATSVATSAFAQQPADTTRRKQPIDTTKPPQPIEAVRIEAAPAPKPATEAERRLRLGGHQYTQKDFERISARGWTDAARMTPGVTVVSMPARPGSTLWVRRLSMQGAGGRCTPAVFVNGMRDSITTLDWDDFIPIEQVIRMEVYSSTNVPMQFMSSNASQGACGSIVLWTRAEHEL